MNNVIIRPKSREEWLEHRKNGIGSSEVATIVGLNPWETPYQLWRRKLGLDPAKDETFAMKAGHYLEDAVAMFWHDETGREIIKRSAGDWIIANKERPYLQVSPDRTYWLSGREFGYKDMEFVPDFYAWLVEEVDRFWTDNIIGKQEPSAQSVQDVLLKYNRHTDGKIVEVNDDIFEAYKDLKGLKEQLSELEERKVALEEKIKVAFGDAEAISDTGRTAFPVKITPKTRNDDNHIKQATG